MDRLFTPCTDRRILLIYKISGAATGMATEARATALFPTKFALMIDACLKLTVKRQLAYLKFGKGEGHAGASL